MSRSFQFSVRQMLGTVALLGVAAQLGELFFASRLDRSFNPVVLFVGFFAAGGAAVGGIAGNPIKGAYVGAIGNNWQHSDPIHAMNTDSRDEMPLSKAQAIPELLRVPEVSVHVGQANDRAFLFDTYTGVKMKPLVNDP